MTPLGDAVGLIHHQHRDGHGFDKLTETLILKTLHRYHQNFQPTGTGILHHLLMLFVSQSGINTGRSNAFAVQKFQLILHQRQQRRHHQRQMGQLQRCKLITEGLTGTGGKDRQRRMSG